MGEPTQLFTRSDVERLIDMKTCIDAVEDAFRQRGEGRFAPSAVAGVHVEGGGFHAKAAALELSRPYFVLKINANFPANPSQRGLPTIQGVLALFNATTGVPLAVMDSMSITTLRTAAASGVAARHLARSDARVATIIGCGVQARAHVAAMSAVRPLERVVLYDIDAARARLLADEIRARYDFEILVADDIEKAAKESDIVATTTSSQKAFLGADAVSPGAFIAAVGADSEHKQEIDPDFMRSSVVVVDDLEQCVKIGDLHHALAAGLMTRDSVRATLDEVVAGKNAGRLSLDEIIIFDSTGVAIEDVAAASIVYERALAQGEGTPLAFDR